MKKILSIFCLFLAFMTLEGQENTTSKNTDWIFNGNILVRPELDGRDFSNSTYPLTYTGMRVRFGVEKTVFENLNIFIQLQDARYWGQEGGPTKIIDNIDLYQGYAKITNLFETPIYAQAGRFEVAYSDQRIFGSSIWNLPARAWDGLRIGYDTKELMCDLFALTYNWSGVPSVSPSYSYPSKFDSSFSVYGLYSQFLIGKSSKIDFYAYNELNRKRTSNSDYNLNRYTIGTRYGFTFGDIFGKAELAYQIGKAAKLDISSYFAVLSLGYDLQALKISLNADIISGTSLEDRATKTNLFDAPFSSKHSVQGHMDYFVNMENSTLGYGLDDFFIRFFYQQKDSPFNAQFDAHYFMTNKEAELPTGNYSVFGEEIDVVLSYMINKAATIEWGGGVFLPDDLMKEIWAVPNSRPVVYRDDMSFWSYLALKVNVF